MSNPARTESSGVIMPRAISWRRRLAARFVAGVMKLLIKTWRYRYTYIDVVEKGSGPAIFCFWHNRLGTVLAIYNEVMRRRPVDGMAGLISASRDGGFLAEIVRQFGVQPVRGSSSRRGPQALLETTTWLEKNYHVSITPDGPRGPRYKVQGGVVVLAQVTGRPIIPVANYVSHKFLLRSWDKFQIPWPFAVIDYRFGSPIYVPRELDDAGRERIRQELENAMMAITQD